MIPVISIQKWADLISCEKMTNDLIFSYIQENFYRSNYITSIDEAKKINSNYRIYDLKKPSVIYYFEKENEKYNYTEKYSVAIQEVWLGNGANIDFLLIEIINN